MQPPKQPSQRQPRRNQSGKAPQPRRTRSSSTPQPKKPPTKRDYIIAGSIVGLLLLACTVCGISAFAHGSNGAPTTPTTTTPSTQAAQIAATARPTTAPTAKPTTAPTAKPAARSTVAPTQAPKPTPTPAPRTGVNGNPWGYNFNPGNLIYNPPSAFCGQYFSCVSTFWVDTNGYVAECANGEYTHSGGVRGACSRDGGVAQTLYSHEL